MNLAVAVIVDAAHDRFDRAILLTGDRDQRPTVRAISVEFGKSADVWITPNQEAGFWKVAEAYRGVRVRTIKPAMLENIVSESASRWVRMSSKHLEFG